MDNQRESQNPDVYTMWSLNLIKDTGGDYWAQPKIHLLKRGVRVGWRWTAWALSFDRTDAVRDENGDLQEAEVGGMSYR